MLGEMVPGVHRIPWRRGVVTRSWNPAGLLRGFAQRLPRGCPHPRKHVGWITLRVPTWRFVVDGGVVRQVVCSRGGSWASVWMRPMCGRSSPGMCTRRCRAALCGDARAIRPGRREAHMRGCARRIVDELRQKGERNRGLLIVMPCHGTLLSDESTQDRSVDCVDEGVAGATTAVGGALGDVEQVLAGSLIEQTRRCGRAGCGCALTTARPVTYFTPKPAGRGRSTYVPAGWWRRCARLVRGEQVAEVIAEISAINAELLARRELIAVTGAAAASRRFWSGRRVSKWCGGGEHGDRRPWEVAVVNGETKIAGGPRDRLAVVYLLTELPQGSVQITGTGGCRGGYGPGP